MQKISTIKGKSNDFESLSTVLQAPKINLHSKKEIKYNVFALKQRSTNEIIKIGEKIKEFHELAKTNHNSTNKSQRSPHGKQHLDIIEKPFKNRKRLIEETNKMKAIHDANIQFKSLEEFAIRSKNVTRANFSLKNDFYKEPRTRGTRLSTFRKTHQIITAWGSNYQRNNLKPSESGCMAGSRNSKKRILTRTISYPEKELRPMLRLQNKINESPRKGSETPKLHERTPNKLNIDYSAVQIPESWSPTPKLPINSATRAGGNTEIPTPTTGITTYRTPTDTQNTWSTPHASGRIGDAGSSCFSQLSRKKLKGKKSITTDFSQVIRLPTSTSHYENSSPKKGKIFLERNPIYLYQKFQKNKERDPKISKKRYNQNLIEKVDKLLMDIQTEQKQTLKDIKCVEKHETNMLNLFSSTQHTSKILEGLDSKDERRMEKKHKNITPSEYFCLLNKIKQQDIRQKTRRGDIMSKYLEQEVREQRESLTTQKLGYDSMIIRFTQSLNRKKLFTREKSEKAFSRYMDTLLDSHKK